MAKRPSIKDILEAARKGGPAKQAESEALDSASEPPEAAPAPEPEASAAPKAATPAGGRPAPAAPRPAPAAKAPGAAAPGRPLTLKEKLAAARAGGAGAPASSAAEPAPAEEVEPAIAEAAAEEPPAEEPKAVPARPAEPLGRPMTLAEKLAAARGAAAKPAGGAAAPKPAAAKAAAAPAAKAGAARALPPLEKMTDPKDLAEAARQAAAKKAKELAAKTAASAPAPAKAAPKAPPKPQTVPPRPTRELAAEPAAAGTSRRGLFVGGLLISWIAIAWTTFTAGLTAMTLMTLRFMFPNVLAEPPSTIKIGLPGNYEPEAVNEKYKAESGFWVVRSARYNGTDIIYALQSVCTHLGCPPNWLVNEQKFKCPCHGSGFYISGINFEGPAPRPLERFKVTLADDGQILVDKSQKFQQELGQWSDPDSFIPA